MSGWRWSFAARLFQSATSSFVFPFCNQSLDFDEFQPTIDTIFEFQTFRITSTPFSSPTDLTLRDSPFAMDSGTETNNAPIDRHGYFYFYRNGPLLRERAPFVADVLVDLAFAISIAI